MPPTYHTQVNVPVEWSFLDDQSVDDPFNEMEVDVQVRAPSGAEMLVPAFWGGGNEWRVRFAPRETGRHEWSVVWRDRANREHRSPQGAVQARPYEGDNPLYRRGPLQISPGKRYFEHADGTPFLWLADTWWHTMSQRISFPADFDAILRDRVAKGFNTVQVVVGQPPSAVPYDPRVENEGGYAWEPDWARINPAYFDNADRRIDWTVRSGVVPCIFSGWAWYLHWYGADKMKQYWRNLIARYGAYPVVWCLCGEITRPWLTSDTPDEDRTPEALATYRAKNRELWNDVGRYVRKIDPYHRLVTGHPGGASRRELDEDVVDFDMLQTGHHDRFHFPRMVREVTEAYARQPAKPMFNSEAVYEGSMGYNREEMQRLAFWTCVLSGACGHSYGALGVYNANRPGDPYGELPGGEHKLPTPWQEGMNFKGSTQVGLGKKFLERFRWWELEPHPEWASPRWSESDYFTTFTAGIPGKLRLTFIYVEVRIGRGDASSLRIRQLEPGVSYRAYFWDPTTGAEYPAGTALSDANGEWQPPPAHIHQDWVLALEAAGARVEA